MNVLVTGHDGYIGAVLAPYLVSKGHSVTGLDTGYFQDCWLGDPVPHAPMIRKDVRDITARDVELFDAIIHLAAISNDPLGDRFAEATLAINAEASVALARLAKAAGLRFLYASSCSLYGKSGQDWMDESSPTAPLTAYAKSKVAVEAGLIALSDASFTPVVLRCATVFGLSPKLRLDLVVNNLAAWGFTTGKIQLQSDGTPWRPLIHVHDLARAYEALLTMELESGRDYTLNVGFTSHNWRVREVAEAVGQVLPEATVTLSDAPDRDSRSYRVTFDRFEQLTGLVAEYDLVRAVRELVDAFRMNGLTEGDFRGRKYVRLNQIQHLIETGALDTTLRWMRREAAHA